MLAAAATLGDHHPALTSLCNSVSSMTGAACYVAGAKPSTGKPLYSEGCLARQNAADSEAAICLQECSSGPGVCAAPHGNLPAI